MLRVEIPGQLDVLALHRQAPERYPFLLESVAAHPQAGRYDILFAFPGQALETGKDGLSHAGWFDRLSTESAAARCASTHGLPFCGGWFLLLGYEAARGVEAGLRLPATPYRLPDALAVRCPAAVIVDREMDRSLLLAESEAVKEEKKKKKKKKI